MKIDGKALAAEIINDLEREIKRLKQTGTTPRIAIVTLGPEASWEAYVKQKIKLAETLDIQTQLINLEDANQEELLKLIHELNNDPKVHGIIVQRPFPEHIDNEIIVNAVSPEKDIDGFRNDSKFEVPVWLAVRRILEEVDSQTNRGSTPAVLQGVEPPLSWLQNKTIAVVGKGITAGTPTISGLKKLGSNPIVVSRSTENPSEELQKADIIISAVGKTVIKPEDLKRGVVLIGIGLHRGEDGKLHGDFRENEIEDIASFYTPSPGGVGPINLAFLFSNLIKAAKK